MPLDLRDEIESNHKVMSKHNPLIGWVIIALIVSGGITSGCAFKYYTLRIMPKDTAAARNLPKEGLAVHMSYMVSKLTKYPLNNYEELYKQTTIATCKLYGYGVTYVPDINSADIAIHIQISPYPYELPQEWLTGLSFGLIPSWGKREDEYIYRFADRSGKIVTYHVDEKSFNHLIDIPFFWISFFFLDEQRMYRKALAAYLETGKGAQREYH